MATKTNTIVAKDAGTSTYMETRQSDCLLACSTVSGQSFFASFIFRCFTVFSLPFFLFFAITTMFGYSVESLTRSQERKMRITVATTTATTVSFVPTAVTPKRLPASVTAVAQAPRFPMRNPHRQSYYEPPTRW